MKFIKCPRCELNYIPGNERYCSVCKKELKGEPDISVAMELCEECGEHPALGNSGFCVFCLRSKKRQKSNALKNEDKEEPDMDIQDIVVDDDEAETKEIPDINELEIDIPNEEIPPDELSEIDKALGSEILEEDLEAIDDELDIIDDEMIDDIEDIDDIESPDDDLYGNEDLYGDDDEG